MRGILRVLGAVALAMAVQQAAEAGAPLKGVDVKLGKNPGGLAASRTTDEHGNADFGTWPRGNYTISVVPAAGDPDIHVTVQGATGGTIERNIHAAAAARTAPIAFAVDGSRHIQVTVMSDAVPVGAVRIKSHSNSTNNN